MAALSEVKVEKVSCGAFHTLIVTADNELYACGAGEFGECGKGDNKNLHVPTKIVIPKLKSKDKNEAASIIDARAGGKHSMVLTQPGELYTFGFGDQG